MPCAGKLDGQYAHIDKTEPADIEAATDAAIALCDGDPRATVKALLIANAFLEEELALKARAVSYGYSRGWHRQKRAR
jgi:hypothetical protein